MGSGVSSLCSCFKPVNRKTNQPDVVFADDEALDETLGHSFCYVRSSARFASPGHSDRYLSPTSSLRFSPTHEPASRTRPDMPHETGFRAISGASVSANSSVPRTVLQLDNFQDDVSDANLGGGAAAVRASILNGFESTSSFSALPLQPVPRGGDPSGPLERSGFFLSGPIERGALSGPIDASAATEWGGRVPFSAPLGDYHLKKRKKGMSRIRKAFPTNFSEKKRPWVVPVLNFVGRKEVLAQGEELEVKSTSNVQWALGKAGEDRVHVVVPEEQGWLFVGIYDGFNGPDAPEFLMSNLYYAVYNELQDLFWEVEGAEKTNGSSAAEENEAVEGITPSSQIPCDHGNGGGDDPEDGINTEPPSVYTNSSKKVTFQSEGTEIRQRRRLWEFLAEGDAEAGLDLSGSGSFAFSVDDALSVSNAGSAMSRRWLLFSKLKHGLSKHKEGHSKSLFPWKYSIEDKEKAEVENRLEDNKPNASGRKRKVGPVDDELVLRALARALEVTELAYLDMTEKVLSTNAELALMGSCVLAVLMRDEDVYVMNVGDSRAIVARYVPRQVGTKTELIAREGDMSSIDGVLEDTLGETSADLGERTDKLGNEGPAQEMRLTALQLSTDHSTSIEEEILRIKAEHPDDNNCILNDRVKGRLKVTRSFGAGFLKKPKLNDAVLEMFRNEYIGSDPYLSCLPSLCHHQLCPRDQFLILSSDGLYQYLSNQEVVSLVENFMEKYPDGDPAQHLIEELLLRAARKAGLDVHALLDIPQGDRRKYHDDVTVMVISLEGRIWKKSTGNYGIVLKLLGLSGASKNYVFVSDKTSTEQPKTTAPVFQKFP